MVALREHWDDVMSRLPGAKGEQFRVLVENMGGADQATIVTEIADFLVENLPPEHPVRRALAEGYLFQSTAIDWTALELDLRGKAKDGPSSIGGLILRSVVERLLSAPALTEDEVRQRGGDPADPGLIRLDRADGSRQWPQFQFAVGAGPLPVVQAVNQVLGAAADPVGAADWWLSRNGWLNGEPHQLIGRVPDDVLMRAARAIRSEV